jgi:Cu/Ag efflux pump CusA
MISYTLSLVVVVILLLLAIRYILREHFPHVHKSFGWAIRLVRRAFRRLIDRLGWFRSLFLMYLLAAVIITLVILSKFFDNFLANTGALTIAWLPAIATWKSLRYLKKRREGHYHLPGRRE